VTLTPTVDSCEIDSDAESTPKKRRRRDENQILAGAIFRLDKEDNWTAYKAPTLIVDIDGECHNQFARADDENGELDKLPILPPYIDLIAEKLIKNQMTLPNWRNLSVDWNIAALKKITEVDPSTDMNLIKKAWTSDIYRKIYCEDFQNQCDQKRNAETAVSPGVAAVVDVATDTPAAATTAAAASHDGRNFDTGNCDVTYCPQCIPTHCLSR
jgi:hypothetical protein